MSHHTSSLSGKVALITGAARRIGAVIARRLHHAGMRVIIHYRHSQSEATALYDYLNAERPGSAALVTADLGRHDELVRLAQEAQGVWGQVDALVNNASGFFPTAMGSVTPAQWDELMNSNLRAPFFLTQALAPTLAAVKGAVVNIVDIHAERPLKDYPVYSMAKAGLAMMTRALARELGPHIRVNGVAPGAILWPEAGLEDDIKQHILGRTALHRPGDPRDIANAVVYLLRDAPYVTGHILVVDGGRSLGA
ncbi:MAG: pteridine reductase [Pseudomonadota bacterium]